MTENSTKLQKIIADAKASKNYSQLGDIIPYAKFIGIECTAVGEDLLCRLPPQEDIKGNPILPAIHGGVVGGFMEMAASMYVIFSLETDTLPKVVDFAIDYVRASRMIDTFVECDLVRQGRKIANVRINAWQTTRSEPVATARAHFLLV